MAMFNAAALTGENYLAGCTRTQCHNASTVKSISTCLKPPPSSLNRCCVWCGRSGLLVDAPTVISMIGALERLWEGQHDLRMMGETPAKSIRATVPADPVKVFCEVLDRAANHHCGYCILSKEKIARMKIRKKSSKTKRSNPCTPCAPSSNRSSSTSSVVQSFSAPP